MTTTTRIRSRWLIAWDGERQRLVPHGEVVFEGDSVIFVGRAYHGPVDREVDAGRALVAPGFVNVHVHAGPLAVGRLFADTGRREPDALGFLNYSAPRAGRAPAPAGDVPAMGALTLAELLRFGTTTAVEIGGETGIPPGLLRVLAPELGIRLVLGEGFRSYDYVTDAGGVVGYRARDDLGARDLRRAVAFAEEILAAADPYVGAMLFPLQVDTCTPELLRDANRAAAGLGIGMQLHAAQGLFEVRQLMQRSGQTPLAYLDAAGALGPATIVAHGILLGGHSWLPYRRDDDLERLASSGAGLAHCPLAMARRGLALESFERYRQAGVRIAIGTDTYPRDLVQELRWASYLSRVADRDFATASAWEVFSAATDVAADLLGRADLGRLAPGCRADVVVVDLEGYPIGPVFDPLAAWLHTGSGSCVRDVYVGGIRRVDGGRVVAVDERDLLERQQAEAERAWADLPNWEPEGRGALEIDRQLAGRLWNDPTSPDPPD